MVFALSTLVNFSPYLLPFYHTLRALKCKLNTHAAQSMEIIDEWCLTSNLQTVNKTYMYNTFTLCCTLLENSLHNSNSTQSLL